MRTTSQLARWLSAAIEPPPVFTLGEGGVSLEYGERRFWVTPRLNVREDGRQTERSHALEQALRAIASDDGSRVNYWLPACEPPQAAALGRWSRRVIVDTTLGNQFCLAYRVLPKGGEWERAPEMAPDEEPAFWIDVPRW